MEHDFKIRNMGDTTSILQDDSMKVNLNIVKKLPLKALIRGIKNHGKELRINADPEGMAKTMLALKYISQTIPKYGKISGIVSQKKGTNVTIGKAERSIRIETELHF
jgi:glycerol-3-phosphate responsive antiterminator